MNERITRAMGSCLLTGAIFFLLSCASKPEHLSLPFSYEVPRTAVKRLSLSTAFVLPDAMREGIQSIEFRCSSKTYLLPVGRELERQARLTLSQAVEDLYLVKNTAMAIGQADLVIEPALPVLDVTVECPSKRIAAYVANTLLVLPNLLLFGLPGYMDTDRPGQIEGEVAFRFAVTDNRGRNLIQDEFRSSRFKQKLDRHALDSVPSTLVDDFQHKLTEALQSMVHRIVDAGEIRRYARNLQGAGKVELRTSAATSSDVDTVSARKSPAHTNRYAIVIGIEQYRSHLPKADFANRDAVMMAQYLTNVMGYPEENVVVLLNENASLTDVMKYVEDWLPRKVKRDGSVFVYYSGHGAPNVTTKEAYILPYDGDPGFLKATGYSLNRLYEKLGQLPAKEIVVALDSCFSGAGGRSVVAEGARPVGLEIDGSLPSHKIAVLTASSGTQISSSYSEQGHGLFTYFLLKGLRSEGDVNRDGAVDLGELFNYVQAQVPAVARKHYNNEQTPQLIGPSEWGRRIRLVESAP